MFVRHELFQKQTTGACRSVSKCACASITHFRISIFLSCHSSISFRSMQTIFPQHGVRQNLQLVYSLFVVQPISQLHYAVKKYPLLQIRVRLDFKCLSSTLNHSKITTQSFYPSSGRPLSISMANANLRETDLLRLLVLTFH